MLTEIDGQRLWRAWAAERAATKGNGTRVSKAWATALKQMPSSVLEPHVHRVVNYRTVVDVKDAVSWYMAWARPTGELAWWQRPLLWFEQIKFSVAHLYRRWTTRSLYVIDKKLESELFMNFFSEEMHALYQKGGMTIGQLVLGQPSLFLGE